jgi:hypothetical protein
MTTIAAHERVVDRTGTIFVRESTRAGGCSLAEVTSVGGET